MVKIRDLRKQKGFTQQQLADIVGVSNVSLSNYERGVQTPDIETLSRLADALGVSVDTLIGRNIDLIEDHPITHEAKILAKGVDKLPPSERKQLLEIAHVMFKTAFDDEVYDETEL